MTADPAVARRAVRRAAPSCARLLVDRLVAHGADTVFGIPGTHSLGLYEALADSPLRHVTTRHEQGAGYAADGYARVTGRPGVVFTTSGPGLLNAAAAVGQAYSDSVPLLVVSPGMPRGHRPGTGALHEVKDQRGVMAALCGWSRRVGSAAELLDALDEAYAGFGAARARPVHVEVPVDLLDAPVAGPPPYGLLPAGPPPYDPSPADPPPYDPSPTEPPATPPAGLAAAAAVLAAARRPVIVAGGGAVTAGPELAELAALVGAAVVTSVNGKGVFPEDHPSSLGAGLHLAAVHAALAEADAVLAVGTELSPADTWDRPLAVPGPLVRVDLDPGQLHRNAEAAHPLCGPAGPVLAALAGAVRAALPAGKRPPGPQLARWRAAVRAEGDRLAAPWAGLVGRLRAALPAGAVLVNDSAQVCYYGATTAFRVAGPRRFLYPTGFGTLGYALPAAIGARTARPDTPVVALCGDGGLQFTLNELATAVELRLPLPVVVVDNGGYGEIRAQMSGRGFRPLAVDVPGPDPVALARAFGAAGVHAASPAAAARAVAAALRADGPTVVAIRESDCRESDCREFDCPESDCRESGCRAA
ncbi:5-guanidino-2-oxopentanoate decarboxylase [Kitasatospora sp. NPDC094011]|uniref:5-guanidino-2-oxopentanoate decarboxylase n=1 Tax=Kitasatospora sp. NPDC094011 TaxID=3364090 RepID=UPI00382A457F